MSLVLVAQERNIKIVVADRVDRANRVDRMATVVTGFHAIKEALLEIEANAKSTEGVCIYYSKTGPRIKQILEIATHRKIRVVHCDAKTLDKKTATLDVTAKDHRGIVLELQQKQKMKNNVDFHSWLSASNTKETLTVLVLDHITDLHNVGAILRSADQFACDLVIFPQKRSPSPQDNEIVMRASSGAASWVKICTVSNLVQCVKLLKDNDFWIYAADEKGQSCCKMNFAKKTCLVMGSEGSGIQDILKKNCDMMASIPTYGKIDSLNVSVATGILLYEIARQRTN